MDPSSIQSPHTPNAALDLRELIAEHGDRLLRSAALLCGDATEAQDLVQETFVQALRAFARFRGEGAIYTWLYGILLNLSRRHRRKQSRFVYDDERVLSEMVAAPDVADADRVWCADGLARALTVLSPEHREAIVLRYYEGLKIEEIARLAGLSTGTVKSRLHYALRQLAQIVPGEMNLFATGDTQDRDRT